MLPGAVRRRAAPDEVVQLGIRDLRVEERRRIFEEAWQHGGGFRFMFGTFGDIATDEDAQIWS